MLESMHKTRKYCYGPSIVREEGGGKAGRKEEERGMEKGGGRKRMSVLCARIPRHHKLQPHMFR